MSCRTALLVIATLSGCTTFSAMTPPTPDSGMSSTEDGARGEILLSDSCGAELLPGVEPSSAVHRIGTLEWSDSMSTFDACGAPAQLPGPDGFFAFDAIAGDRVHLAVEPETSDQDVALYYLTTCDPSACAMVHDRCGEGEAEQSTFIVPHVGQWIVGLESDRPGSLRMRLERPRCGDGDRSNGESCDDGNLDAGDGCDALCRSELHGAWTDEIEPNDDRILANVAAFERAAAVTLRIAGRVGRGCDVDRFLLDLRAGALVTARVLDEAGQACAQHGPPISLELRRDDETSPAIGTGVVGRSAGECPSIEAPDEASRILSDGRYHLVVSSPADAAFDYVLVVELVLP